MFPIRPKNSRLFPGKPYETIRGKKIIKNVLSYLNCYCCYLLFVAFWHFSENWLVIVVALKNFFCGNDRSPISNILVLMYSTARVWRLPENYWLVILVVLYIEKLLRKWPIANFKYTIHVLAYISYSFLDCRLFRIGDRSISTDVFQCTPVYSTWQAIILYYSQTRRSQTILRALILVSHVVRSTSVRCYFRTDFGHARPRTTHILLLAVYYSTSSTSSSDK